MSPSAGLANVLCEVFPRPHAPVQRVLLSCGPHHLLAREASSPAASRVHRDNAAQTRDPGLHVGQAQIAGSFSRLTCRSAVQQ